MDFPLIESVNFGTREDFDFGHHTIGEKSKKPNIREKAYKLLDKHYNTRNSNFLEAIAAGSLKFWIDTKRWIEDMVYSMTYKDEYKQRNKKIERENKKQSKEFDKQIRQQIFSDPIWQDKKTGASRETIKHWKELLKIWRKKMLSFSKNKYYYTDVLIRYLTQNKLTFRDIGMTKAEREIILG